MFRLRSANTPPVMPGLDSGIHWRRLPSLPPRARGGRMDSRIKSGHDVVGTVRGPGTTWRRPA